MYFGERRTVANTQGQHALCIAVIRDQNGGETLSVPSRYLVRASERCRIPGSAVLKAIDFGVDVKTFAILTYTAAHSR